MRVAVAGGTGLVGRYVVDAASARGHQVVVLSRSHGVDLKTGEGLDPALEGVEAIVEVTNPRRADRQDAAEFFTRVAAQLQTHAARHAVRHIVTLSIAGIDRQPEHAYYAAKVLQEQVALGGRVPASVVRATQFHEFAAQTLGWNRRGTLVEVHNLRVQTVSARTVGEVLIEMAEQPPVGLAPDLAGPDSTDLIARVRAFAERYAPHLSVVDAGSLEPLSEANLPRPGARIEGPTFETWLESDDAGRLVIA